MSIFVECKIYGIGWHPVKSRSFSDEEKAAVSSAVVVSSEYGNSAMFIRSDGGCMYIPMDRKATLGVGEKIDMEKAKVVTYERLDKTITRILI